MNNLLNNISLFARESLLVEVYLYPKPGLVDFLNNGSHVDMDYQTFLDSVQGLDEHLCAYSQIGNTHEGDLKVLFKKLREQGKKAEKSMFAATHGINTHKGANFSFALILGAIGFYLGDNTVEDWGKKDTQKVFEIIAQMCEGLVEADLDTIKNKDLKKLTPGEKQYFIYGSKGVRGLAADGYPILTEEVLPYARNLFESSHDLTGNLLMILVLLISKLEDINILNRSNYETLENIRQIFSSNLSNLSPENVRTFLYEWDEYFQYKNISPGGSADLLSIVIMFMIIEGYIPSESEDLWGVLLKN